MQIKQLNECIDMLKGELGKSLLVADIWSVAEGMSIAEYGAKAGSAASINSALGQLNKSSSMGTLPIGKYILLDLQGGSRMIVVPMNEYCASIVIDKEVQLGLFLHIMLPSFIDKFEEAVVA